MNQNICSDEELQHISGKKIISELANNRKDYAKINFGSMGVNLNEHFMSLQQRYIFNYSSSFELNIQPTHYAEAKHQIKKEECNNPVYSNENSKMLQTLKSGRLQNYSFQHFNYALRERKDDNMRKKGSSCENLKSITKEYKNEDLPIGWEKHEDNDGPYYWHIKSGTIQRESPFFPIYKFLGDEDECLSPGYEFSNSPTEKPTAISPDSHSYESQIELKEFQNFSMTRSRTISSLNPEKQKADYVGRYYPLRNECSRLVRFVVRSLGWIRIAEEDLVPERSSRAVNKCIIDLSLRCNNCVDVPGRWGDGKKLYMDLEDGSLKLIDMENFSVLNSQPIHTIRVWGVGRDNGRDFAYVSRDKITRTHMCHVFRCETAARIIANTLRSCTSKSKILRVHLFRYLIHGFFVKKFKDGNDDICKQIMIERSLQLDTNSTATNIKKKLEPSRSINFQTKNLCLKQSQSFPIPIEEPKKTLKALYMGWTEVDKPTGMEIINEAINNVIAHTKAEDWENVNVSIAPSMISVRSAKDYGRLIAECRVRYLSFLGIGKNFKKCAFIVHTSRNKFVAHVFHCEPSSGALCKTVEAACKLRYQKCLDAHPESIFTSDFSVPCKSIGSTIKNIMYSMSIKKDKFGS